ncbi:MAG: zinc-binding dehydrogenase [Vulcanimicrobiaceae bacterium]
MTTMKAVRLHELGGPAKLAIEEVERPAPQADEVLIHIHAAAFNRRDVFITQGLYPGIELPRTLGSDGAGIVARVGAGVNDLQAGDEVVINPMLGWGNDPHMWDPGASILGMPRDGTFAEYVVVPRTNVYPKPSGLSMEEAAALPLAGLTAYRATFTRGELRSGETVLIPGIGGGVQTFVLLYAKSIGARSIVTSGSEEKLERAKQLGADVAIDYRSDDWHKVARKAGPIDLVVDSSGGDTLAKSLAAVRPGGRIVVYGGTRGDATIKLFPLFWNHVDIRGTSMGSPSDFRAMLELVARGIKPVVDRVYPMSEVVAAARRMAASEQFGKIILQIA